METFGGRGPGAVGRGDEGLWEEGPGQMAGPLFKGEAPLSSV